MVTTIIVIVFVLGYLNIAMESVLKINKAAFSLAMCVVCWALFAFGGYAGDNLNEVLGRNLGDAGTTIFFLMGAMTIVELVDQYGGFNFVSTALQSKSKRALLWKMSLMTFFLSAVLDNLTTTIVMLMILRKLVSDHKDRVIYASMVILAANSGGAFSPIGDVTTIMLWNGGMISSLGVIKEIIVPSMASCLIPTAILQYRLKGDLMPVQVAEEKTELQANSPFKRRLVFILGVGGLCSVPVFHGLTGLPPFMGILLVLCILWMITDLFYYHNETPGKRIVDMLSRIDMSTILFFLGILMAVSTLAEVGVLQAVGTWLDKEVGNHYMVTGIIGLLSSVVDNVPLVAGSMRMYPIALSGDMAMDGIFWQLLAYCAGVGGSLLIIGSAAGVVTMGLEKITFGWYMKHITWVALVGYLAGMLIYWLEKAVIGL